MWRGLILSAVWKKKIVCWLAGLVGCLIKISLTNCFFVACFLVCLFVFVEVTFLGLVWSKTEWERTPLFAGSLFGLVPKQLFLQQAWGPTKCELSLCCSPLTPHVHGLRIACSLRMFTPTTAFRPTSRCCWAFPPARLADRPAATEAIHKRGQVLRVPAKL